MTILTAELTSNWSQIEPYFRIKDDGDYERAVDLLNQLLDEIGDDESHPMYAFMDTLGLLVENYEDEHYPMPKADGIGVLRYLMEEHDLRQVDLPEIGSQGVVSEILNGRRELNVRQVRALAKRFGVSAEVFI
jgi:HTH-type transcriptional regulator / antitoxin HigA